MMCSFLSGWTIRFFFQCISINLRSSDLDRCRGRLETMSHGSSGSSTNLSATGPPMPEGRAVGLDQLDGPDHGVALETSGGDERAVGRDREVTHEALALEPQGVELPAGRHVPE